MGGNWLNGAAVKSMSRIMLVVVLLLLPVIVTGASLEVPGVRCSVQNCCAMAHCGEHEELGAAHDCLLHGHHHHHHERIQLLFDAGGKAPVAVVAGVVCEPPPFAFCSAFAWGNMPAVEAWLHPPLYPGYMHPQRC